MLERLNWGVEMRLGSSGSNNGVIDWSQIRTVDDLENIVGDALYDESDDSPDAGAFGDIEIADGLTPYEIADAERWARFTRGVMLITGVPGSGKTALMNILAWKFRRYFRRRVILDSKPRRIFGPYVYYTHEFLYEMAERLRLYTGINTKSGHDAKHWYTERGEI
ncbi:MAG: hypothetical protein ABIN58_11560, partial [candidate division WOR-3 bacterium]